MLASPAGSLGLVASSSEAMRLLELFELQEQEGPCLDAFRTGERVTHENLGAGAGRWPSFSAAALRAGFASASALPLRLREVTLGALNLLSVTRAPMEDADVIVARAFADLAALSITQHRASAEAQRLNEQLSSALTSRVVIEQAKGVISERTGVDLAQAFARLRAHARNHNLRLTDVARAAIDGTLRSAGLGRRMTIMRFGGGRPAPGTGPGCTREYTQPRAQGQRHRTAAQGTHRPVR
jgi:GAF domain-containing protein